MPIDIEKILALEKKATPGIICLTTEEEAFPNVWLDLEKERDITIDDLNLFDELRNNCVAMCTEITNAREEIRMLRETLVTAEMRFKYLAKPEFYSSGLCKQAAFEIDESGLLK